MFDERECAMGTAALNRREGVGDAQPPFSLRFFDRMIMAGGFGHIDAWNKLNNDGGQEALAMYASMGR